MNLLLFLSDAIIPILIFSIVGYGMITHHDVYDDFIKGAKDGLHTVIGIMPTLIGLMVGVGVLRASGFLDLLSSILGVITEPLQFPAELVPVSIVKMFSSSAATGLVLDIFKEFGPKRRLILLKAQKCAAPFSRQVKRCYISWARITLATVPAKVVSSAPGKV